MTSPQLRRIFLTTGIVTALMLTVVIAIRFLQGPESKSLTANCQVQGPHVARKLFEQTPKLLKMTIAFGYKDARPARFVGDRYERGLLIQFLRDHNFVRDHHDDDLFWREADHSRPGIQVPRIEVRIVHSSVGPDDVENRKNPAQKWQSDVAEKIYLKSLSEADAVFYVGHSRAGGGPDFEPPRIRKDGGVNLSAYRQEKEGLNKTLKALRESSKPTSLLGLYSCSSTQHFKKLLGQAAPNMDILSHPLPIYYIDALNDLKDVLAKILAPTCVSQDGAAKS